MLELRRSLGLLAMLFAVVAPISALAFDAGTLAGTWVGTWKNLRFKGVGGPFTIVITATDADTITVDASGADFGCGALTTPVVLKRGTDWTDAGAMGTFDTITLTYDGASRTLTGTGSNCHGTWVAAGRVKKNGAKFKGKSLTTVGGGKAKSKIKASRQP